MTLIDDARRVRDGEELDVAVVDRYLKSQLPELQGTPEVRQFPGGASNLTYLVRYDNRDLILRRPPFGKKAKGAHDMAREYHLLEKIHPVLAVAPAPALLVEDPAVLGSPFYLMERRRGTVVRTKLPAEYAALPDAPRQMSQALADTLADLHAVDIDAAGLRGIGKPEGFNRRQVEGWAGRWRRARELLKDSGDLPPPAELRDELVGGRRRGRRRHLGSAGEVLRVQRDVLGERGQLDLLSVAHGVDVGLVRLGRLEGGRQRSGVLLVLLLGLRAGDEVVAARPAEGHLADAGRVTVRALGGRLLHIWAVTDGLGRLRPVALTGRGRVGAHASGLSSAR